jgi:hypothetical protein
MRLSNYFEHYIIKRHDGATMVYKGKNYDRFIEEDELEALIGHLANVLAALKSGLNFETILTYAAQDTLKTLLETDVTWVSPVNFDKYLPKTRSRGKRSAEQFSCVYFVQDPQNPSAIKIGFTDNLGQRMSAFYRLWGHSNVPRLLAVARTNYPIQLERVFHEYFRSYWIDGEWFQSEPVIAFLEETMRAKS